MIASMTEEDTFRKLRQIPYEEAYNLYMHRWLSNPASWSENDADKFLEQYGWTYTELHSKALEGNGYYG